jgi:ribulose-phosphate 3-epimerase
VADLGHCEKGKTMTTKKIYIAPSILSADLLKLEEQVRKVADNGADFIHIDVMDGHFVPNLTYGPNMVEAVKRITDVPLDVHLMIANPARYIDDYINAGANYLTFHQEASVHLHRTIQAIHNAGAKAGISLNPGTPSMTLKEVLPDLDMVLVMTVNPGFGGQQFIRQGLRKIAEIRAMADTIGKDLLLNVDGGVNTETAKEVVDAGANMLVAGSAIFKQVDIVAAMKAIVSSAMNA